MRLNRITAICLCVLSWTGDAIAQEVEPPETGYFKISMTPTDVIGEAGAQGMADVFPPDEEIDWQLYVPHNYSADHPPGVVVYVSPWERGGPPRSWNELLGEQNLIWIGANGAGNKNPVVERMLKALFAPSVLAKTYKINTERLYVAGFSGGSMTAMRVASLWPEKFKGGVYIAGAVFWEGDPPPKIDLIKQNRHVFMVGTYDQAMDNTKRVYNDYLNAGIKNSRLIKITNHQHRMPPETYFVRAIEFLDSGTTYQDQD